MSNRAKVAVWIVLLAVLVWQLVALSWPSSTPPRSAVAGRLASARAAAASPPPEIPDADLQVEWLKPGNGVAADEIKRNIFEYASRAEKPKPKVETPVEQPPPPPPPPPKPPFRFYGFAQGSAGGARRVLLTDGESVFVAVEGEIIAGRYRIAKVEDKAIEVEDMQGSQRWVIPLENP